MKPRCSHRVAYGRKRLVCDLPDGHAGDHSHTEQARYRHRWEWTDDGALWEVPR